MQEQVFFDGMAMNVMSIVTEDGVMEIVLRGIRARRVTASTRTPDGLSEMGYWLCEGKSMKRPVETDFSVVYTEPRCLLPCIPGR